MNPEKSAHGNADKDRKIDFTPCRLRPACVAGALPLAGAASGAEELPISDPYADESLPRMSGSLAQAPFCSDNAAGRQAGQAMRLIN